MKIITLILFSLAFTFFAKDGYSQKSVIKMTAYYSAYSIKGNSERNVNECNILMVWDYNKPSLTIYAKEVQKYSIIDYKGKTFDRNRTGTMAFIAIDNEGTQCLINDDKEKDGTMKLYVFRKNFTICYYYKFED